MTEVADAEDDVGFLSGDLPDRRASLDAFGKEPDRDQPVHPRLITRAKAVEQLGSDKLEVRLGGIYSLERISKESPDDYWTVMENLTAFVRERSRRNEAERTSQDLEQRVSRRAYFSMGEGWPARRAGCLVQALIAADTETSCNR